MSHLLPRTTALRPPAGRQRRDLWSAVAAVTAVTLPTFLVGTLAVQIRAQLHFGPAQLGLLIGTSSAASALLAVPSGNFAEQFGGLRMLRYSAGGAAVAMFLIASVATSWLVLALCLVLAGAASASGQTASNLFLSRRIESTRQGRAFGIKQAAVPFAFLLGGLAVPAIALTVGWRWAFVVAGLLALAAVAALPRPRVSVLQQRRAARGRPRPEAKAPLVALAVGFGLALTACSSLGGFLVISAVANGLSPAAAGLAAALASLLGVAVRILVGMLADRRDGRHLLVVVAMMTVGAAGFLLLAIGSWLRQPAIFVPGAAIAFGIGWGWNGLFNFAVVRTHPLGPARASGITQAGGRTGSVVGPLVFGILVSHVGYAGAWGTAAGEALLGATTMLVARAMLRQRLGRELR